MEKKEVFILVSGYLDTFLNNLDSIIWSVHSGTRLLRIRSLFFSLIVACF